MFGYQEILLEQLKNSIIEADSEEAAEKLFDKLPEIYSGLCNDMSSLILENVKKSAFGGGLDESRKLEGEFSFRNYERWDSGFDHLELLIAISIEMGDLAHRLYNEQSENVQSNLFSILFRLHAKACLISREILCLMKAGFPDGAIGRWRALHEVNVISRFLHLQGEPVAQLFIDHEVVDTYKGAVQYNHFQPRLQVEPIDNTDIEALKKKYDSMNDKHGANFKKEYGWAAVHLGRLTINFSQIEEEVGLDHWRPYYKWASQNVHTSIKSLAFSLGTSEAKEDLLLVGPSNSGMTDAAHQTAISLFQCTSSLLNLFPSIDTLISTKVMDRLTLEIGEEFMNCSKKVQDRQD